MTFSLCSQHTGTIRFQYGAVLNQFCLFPVLEQFYIHRTDLSNPLEH